MNRENDPIQISLTQIIPVARMFSRAFANYRPMRHFIPDDDKWGQVAPFFFQSALRYGSHYGETYVTSADLEGAAVWMMGKHCPLTLWRAFRSGALGSLLQFGRAGGGKMKPLGDFIDALHARMAPFNHWYLQVLGVDPKCQGQGHASRLLRPMLERIDAQGLPCYTDTGDTKNVALYEHFGFSVIKETLVPGTGLKWWAMVRAPADG